MESHLTANVITGRLRNSGLKKYFLQTYCVPTLRTESGVVGKTGSLVYSLGGRHYRLATELIQLDEGHLWENRGC